MRSMWMVLGLVGMVACDGGGSDSGGTGATAATVDSCEWSVGLCYEFTNYGGTEQWCADIGDQSGFGTTYSTGPCPSGDVYVCDLPGVALADDVPVTAYYYADFSNDPADSCSSAGGTPG